MAHIDKNSYWIANQPLRGISRSQSMQVSSLSSSSRRGRSTASTTSSQQRWQRPTAAVVAKTQADKNLAAPLALSKTVSTESTRSGGSRLLERSHSYMKQRKQQGKTVFRRPLPQRSESWSVSKRSTSSPSSVMFTEDSLANLNHLQHPLVEEASNEEDSLSDILGSASSARWKKKLFHDSLEKDDNSVDTEPKSNVSTTSASPVPTNACPSDQSSCWEETKLRVRLSQRQTIATKNSTGSSSSAATNKDTQQEPGSSNSAASAKLHERVQAILPNVNCCRPPSSISFETNNAANARTASPSNEPRETELPPLVTCSPQPLLDQIRTISEDFTSYIERNSPSAAETCTNLKEINFPPRPKTQPEPTSPQEIKQTPMIYSPAVSLDEVSLHDDTQRKKQWYERTFVPPCPLYQSGSNSKRTPPLEYMLCGSLTESHKA